MNLGIFGFALCLLLGKGVFGQSATSCDTSAYRQCFGDLLNTALLAVEEASSSEACSGRNFTSFRECAVTHLDGCSSYLGDVMVSTVRPYVRLLDTVYQKACSGEYEYGDCDLTTAKTCIVEFFHTLSSGGVAKTCKQSYLTHRCLQPALDRCSDLRRYLVAMVMDEIKLTSDLLCHPDSCNLNVAGQLLKEATRLIDCPVTVVRQSSLVCRELWMTLAIVTNQTADCLPSDIPGSFLQNYQLLYRFGSEYCEATVDNYMLTNIPSDLLMSVYLAAVGTSQWTSRDKMCRLFNTTLVQAASLGQHSMVYTEHLFTWRYAMELNLDKYSSTCLNRHMFDCDWVERAANSPGDCDFGAAKECLDMVLLSELVVEVYLQRKSWQTVCVAAYNMLACHQYQINSCMFVSSPNVDTIQKIEQLVGYECSQLGQFDRPDSCDRPQPACRVAAATGECEAIAHSKGDVCQHKEEVLGCFREHTAGCNSAQASTAQFYLDWLLHDCNHNYTILAEDSLSGVSQCQLQRGYNIHSGLFLSSDLSWIVCAAGSLFEQCMMGQTMPSLAIMYGNQYSEFSSQFNAAICNLTRINTSPLPQGLKEPPECQIDLIAGELTLVIQLLSNFPFLSVEDQTVVCGIVPVWLQTIPDRMLNCSQQRQSLMSDVFVYLGNKHAFYCPWEKTADQGACDVAQAQSCLEDFGRYTYFASPGSDHCGQLKKTYDCLYEHSRFCDNATQEALVHEVRAVRSLMGGTACQEPEWCSPDKRDVDSPWVREVCLPQQNCMLYDWETCVDDYGVNQFCSNATEVVTCVQDKLSGCDAPQYAVAKYDILKYINSLGVQFGSCTFGLADPAFISQTDYTLLQCALVFETNYVAKENICGSLSNYLQCVSAFDQTSMSYVWQAVYETNVQMWIKETYVGCQLNADVNFVVNTDFNRDDYTGAMCSSNGVPCLQSLLKDVVTSFYLVPLSQRETKFCERVENSAECVTVQTSGCVNTDDRSLLTSTVWLGEALENVGVCSAGTAKPRACDPEAAMDCLTQLGLVLAENTYNQSTNMVCLKALSAQECVSRQTSSCDFYTRSKVEKTYAIVETIIRNFCMAPLVGTEDMCASQGASQCDVERGLVCFILTQSWMLQQNPIDQICSTIPEMKNCVQLYTSGCDEVTRNMFTKKQLKISAKLNHQCPQMFCEECRARACLRNLYQTLQYEDVHICNAVMETKQCIRDNAQYCDETVCTALLQELDLIVGEDSRLCEITLPSCLQKFMLSAMQIMSFTSQGTMPSTAYENMTASSTTRVFPPYQPNLMSLCDQANTAFFCLDHHLASLNSSRQSVLVQTLHKIGDIVYDKCQGPQMQCYSCVNATSNEECNSMPAQTCAPNMQACGTVVFNNYFLSKGCVSPDVCKSGCYGNTCSHCCQGDGCNQPWDGVLTEPSTCQPLSAVWCGMQLLVTSTQNVTNQTDTCRSLRDSISCMIYNTRDCHSHKKMSMGMLGRQLLASDAVGSCLARNPVCDCGQCTSLLLMSLVSSPYSNTERFCSSVTKLYKKTLMEMDFLECDRATIHSTANNLNNAAYIVQGVCPLNIDNSDCIYNNTVYRHGSSFTAMDGCNKCMCQSGNVGCTMIMCPPDNQDRCPRNLPGEAGICGYTCSSNDDCTRGQICCATACGGTTCTNPEPTNDTKCYYNNQAYNRSTAFQTEDGCNVCVCLETAISCSNYSCVTPDNFTANATCNLGAAQDCIEDASTNYQFGREFFGDDFICDSAAEMLSCLEPRVSSCPEYVMEDVRTGITTNFDEIMDTCDIQAILQQYENTTIGGGQNLTLDRPCSVVEALECFRTTQNNTCREYQDIVDCVSNYTTGCFSMNMAPVLFALERELELLAEKCDIVIPGPDPGPNPTPTPTTGPVTPTDKDYCSYGNRTWSSGNTFRALDGCNFCYCNLGDMICTELSCPYQGDTPACNITGVEQCIQDTHMAYLVSMAIQDGGWQICMSAVQMMRCVEAKTGSCPQNIATTVQNIVWYNLNQVSSVCSLEQILMLYSQNASQPGAGDAQCTTQGVRACLTGTGVGGDLCRSQQMSLQCLYNITKTCYSMDMTPTLRAVKRFFQSNSGCQLEMPPQKDKNFCNYGDNVYKVGDNFMALDGCNFCFCGNTGMVGCTKMYCGDPTLHNATCDVSGAQQCLERAALPYLVAMGTEETRHICLSAAEMLRCVEPKVTACPSDVLQVVKAAVWSDLTLVQVFCDISQLYWLYNETSGGNQTLPDTNEPCSLQEAANCVKIRNGDTACSAYQSMIDCVYDFTAGCLSVDAVPVLYELQRQLEPASLLCDLVTPLMHIDAAYPVAQCTLGLANSLSHSLTLDYLVTGQLDGVCANLDGYLSCLRTADLSTPLGRMYASNALQSVSNLLELCDKYKQEQVPDLVECHSCFRSASMEECDSQPRQTCQLNQVCSTGLQLDPYSGATMVTKGCADLSWCQAAYGCDMQYMTCIHCCRGDLCNAADNTTAYTTASTVQTTTAPARTTNRPAMTTPEMESCDLEPVTVYMTAHIIRLINFNFIPLQQRGPICQNFEMALSSFMDDLECLEGTKRRVQVIAEWLTDWTSEACRQMQDNPVDEIKCHDSLKCLDNFGNFTDQVSTCRMLNKSISCLRTNSAYCTDPVQASVNRSIQLLVDMDHMICVANPLDKHPEPECVDLQSVTNQSVCNETVAQQSARDIQLAVNNPLMEKEQRCRLVKVHMKRIKDHTYNCSSEVLYRAAPGVAQVIQLVYETCPDTWCPANDHCKLDTARECLDDLERHTQEMVTTGYVDMGACLNVTRTHHCVVNATESCYALDRQSVIQRYNSLAQVIVPRCQAQAANTLQCYAIYNEGINMLVSMDQLAISSIVENIVTQIMAYRLFQSANTVNVTNGLINMTDSYGGVNLPGGIFASNVANDNSGRQNPYIRRRRDVNSPEGGSDPSQNNTNGQTGENSVARNKTGNTNPGSEFWTDNTTSVSDNGTDPMRNNSKPDGHLPTDVAPEMAQSGLITWGWEDLYKLLYEDLTHVEYIDTLTSLVNVSRHDIAALVDPHTLMKYSMHKMEVCDHIQQAYQCLNFNLQMIMSPGQQQYMLSTSLDLLAGVAMEICSPQQCHSCSGLESNDQCNQQPIAMCQPLEMCQARTVGRLISKGCTPLLTCEESCRHKTWNQSCYCCHGNMCNKHPDQEKERCEIQKAVGCVQHMLQMSVEGNFWENSTEVYSTAMCMVTSTSGCHSDAYREIHMSGKKMLALYEVVNCSATYDQAFCNLPGASTLFALASSPHQTVSSSEMTCRMFAMVMEAFTSNRTETTCCRQSDNVRLSLLSLYIQIEPFCPRLDVHALCTDPGSGHDCRSDSLGHGVLEHVCESFSLPETSDGSSTCNVSEALTACFAAMTTDPVSICPTSAIELNTTRTCIAQHTNGCNSTQLAPVLSMMRNLVLICPLDQVSSGNRDNSSDGERSSMARNDEEVSPHNTAIICLRSLKNIPDILSQSSNIHTDLCGIVGSVDQCLKDSYSGWSSTAIPGLMSMLANFNKTFCHREGEMSDRLLPEDCEPEDRVQCLVNPCDNVNMTADCPAFSKATCSPDYCGDCNATFFFRGQEVTDICEDLAQVNSCDLGLISTSISRQLNLMMMSPLMVWYETEYVCSADVIMDDLDTEISLCLPMFSEPFTAMLSWLHSQLTHVCYDHIAHRPCVHPRCDISMATEIIDNMGYYLRTWSFDDEVFCQKVKNTLKAVDCVVKSCNSSTLDGIEARLSDIKPQLYSRCPDMMQQVYCSAENQGYDGADNQGRCPPNLPGEVGICGYTCSSNDDCTRGQICCATACGGTTCTNPEPTTTTAMPSSTRPSITPAVTRNPNRPSNAGRAKEATSPARGWCDIESAKLCLYSAGLPAQNASMAPNYCSNLLEAVVRLSECVISTTLDCDRDSMTVVGAYYSGVLVRYQNLCSLNMTRQLMQRLGAGECYVPECSYYESHHCILHLTPDGACGNVEDVSDCVSQVSAGCGPRQRYINEGMLRTAVMSMLPTQCLPNDTDVDTADQPVIQCVEQLMENLGRHFSGNATGPTLVCALLEKFLMCLEASSEDDRVPASLSGAMKQLVDQAAPVLQMLCYSIGNDDITVSREDTARCSLQLHQALAILHSHTVDALLGSIMTQDGRDYVCGYDMDTESWRAAFGYFTGSCGPDLGRDFHMVFNLIEVLGRLTGTCMPQPHTCAPGEAVQCIQDLAHKVELHRMWKTDQQDICSSIQYTKLCIQQTSTDCDHSIQASLMTTLEPVMCKALSICPAMMDQERPTTPSADLPICLSPADAVRKEIMLCNINKAMHCLQSVSGLKETMFKLDKGKACRKYAESMECFMMNLSGCDDATAMFALTYGVKTVEEVGDACPTQIKAFCGDGGHPGCSPDKIHRCFDIVRAAVEGGDEEKMCFAKEQAHQCLAINAEACPHLTKLFIKTKLLMQFAEAERNLVEPHCESVAQCAFNYVTYLSQSFEQLLEMFGNNTGTMCPRQVGGSYECHARSKELNCMMHGIDRLPEDVAQLVNTSLQYTEALFSTACNALNGMAEELRGCNGTCLRCYVQEIRLQSYLPLLWTFAEESQAQDVSALPYNEEFCSSYDSWRLEVETYEANSSCYRGNGFTDWHQGYVSSMEGIYDKYCTRPCNTTQADICLEEFQSASAGDEPCLAYEEARSCLNASTFYCTSDVTNYYTGLLEQVLKDQGFRCYQMPSFEAGYVSSTLLAGVPLSLDVTITSAMVDSCIGEVCEVEISLVFDDPDTTSCSLGDSIQQILTDRCFVDFLSNISGLTHTFHLYNRIDHKVQPDRNVTVTLVARLMEDGEVFFEEDVGQVSFRVENRDTSRLCSMIAQPTIVTFDGMAYFSLSKGEYVVYQHTSLPEKVNVRFQSCGGPLTACPCGVMVQSGDDVYVLDACRRIGQRSQPLTFRVYRNGDYTPHTKVYIVDGISTQFVLPSGSIVFVRYVQQEDLDVWIHPTGLDWNSTLGLCGTYDGDMYNDYTYPNLTVGNASNVRLWREVTPLPLNFLKAWKQSNTLMYGVSEDSGHMTRDNLLCRCSENFDGCEEVDLVETCGFVSGTDYTNLLSVFELDQNSPSRRKRQAVNDEFDESEVDIDQLPTTPGNISVSEAEQFCNSTITSANFWDVCSVIVDTTNIVQMCMDRILLADSYDVVTTSLEALRIECRTAILADPGLSVYLNMTYEILVPYVLNVTCLEDCSGNGQCQNGECVCDQGYKGDDCSLMQNEAPSLASLSENTYISTSASGNMAVTRVVEVYGNSFTNSDSLTCHLEQVQVSTDGYTSSGVSTTQHATFLTVGSVRCEVTGSLPLTGILLTVSNNGQNQSNGLLYIIQDEVCYDCSPTDGNCKIQPTSCVIDDACYSAGQYNEADACYVCDPISNVWHYKTSPNCPGVEPTSTSSTTSSSTSTTSTTPSPSTITSTSSTPSSSGSTPSPSDSTSSPSSSTPSPSGSTSSTTISTSSTTSSTPSLPSSTSRSTPSTPSTTVGSDGDDDRTTLIIVSSVAGVMVVVVFAVVICIACRLKQNDRRRHDESMSTNQTLSTAKAAKLRRGDTHLQGRLNPYFQDVEYATAHGQDQPVVPRRAAPTVSAPFNPQGLSEGEPVSGRAYGGEGGMYEINIGMFEDGRQAKGQSKPTHTWEETGYRIPRPAVEAVYDNAARGSPEKVRKSGGDIQYESGTFTHL